MFPVYFEPPVVGSVWTEGVCAMRQSFKKAVKMFQCFAQMCRRKGDNAKQTSLQIDFPPEQWFFYTQGYWSIWGGTTIHMPFCSLSLFFWHKVREKRSATHLFFFLFEMLLFSPLKPGGRPCRRPVVLHPRCRRCGRLVPGRCVPLSQENRSKPLPSL